MTTYRFKGCHWSMWRTGLAGMVSVALSACGTAPLSFVHGELQGPTPQLLYPVHIVSVDARIQFDKKVQLAPGLHELVLQAYPSQAARGSPQKRVVMAVEPCTRYFLAAQRQSPLDAEWTLIETAKEAVVGCDKDEEIRKARK